MREFTNATIRRRRESAPEAPMTDSPLKIFDAHLHIIDSRFPLVANNGYLPAPFTCQDYRERMRRYDLAGGAVVSGSFQAFDQGYLLEALRCLGPSFVGVTQLPATVSEGELRALDEGGVRALRFNIRRCGSEATGHLEEMALRVHGLVGWHVELYVDSRELTGLVPLLLRLPAVSIDHLGLSREGLPTLLRLAERGVRVKATGFGRVDFDVRQVLRDFHAANPESLMFGTDLPSTRAPRPFSDEDALLVREALGEEGAARVLWQNARSFYRAGEGGVAAG
jgi:predicted TIM-barrel fold metal-dependent hydrolase